MTRFAHIVIFSVVLLLLGAPGLAIERFPPPDFEEGYKLPVTQVPGPRANLYEYLDVAALVVALSLASYLALKKRSRHWTFVLMAASLAYFGFWREGCVCPIGAIQNVVLALTDSQYTLPLVVLAFFLLPLVFTIFFGRTFCAAVCPLGAIQDVVLLRPTRMPRWFDESLGLLAYVYLGAAVLFTATGSAFIICRYDPFIPLFRMSGSMNMLILAACFLVMGIFVGRPYCRYLCPYGAILRWLSRISKWRVTITPDECIQCRLCEDACPFGAIEEPTQRETVRSKGKWRLGGLIVLLPVLVAAGVWIGDRSGVPFARMHPVVTLADRMRLEEAGEVTGTTDASDAFRRTGRPVEALYADASGLEAGFVRGGRWFGAFVGVVIGLKLLSLSVRRKRTDYEADRGRCLACGRCFSYCPMEHRRRKINEGLLAEKPIKKPASEEL